MAEIESRSHPNVIFFAGYAFTVQTEGPPQKNTLDFVMIFKVTAQIKGYG